jgi:hypothetical protein
MFQPIGYLSYETLSSAVSFSKADLNEMSKKPIACIHLLVIVLALAVFGLALCAFIIKTETTAEPPLAYATKAPPISGSPLVLCQGRE